MASAGETLHRFGLARDRLNAAICRSTGLSRSDLHALEFLEITGPITPTELAWELGLTSGAVTTLVDRLEDAGWITRQPNERDRRSILVGLSQAADARGSDLVGAYERKIKRALSALPARDQTLLARTLEELAAVAEAHAERIAKQTGPSGS